MLLAAVAALVLEEDFVNLVFAKLKLERISNAYRVAPRRVNSERQKTRISFEESTAFFSEEEFERAFRMSKRSFHVLLETLGDDLRRRTARNTVKPAARLGITLRLLAGGSYLDEMRHYAIGKTTVYAIFKETRVALLRKLSFPDVLGCPDQLQRLAEEFKVSRKGVNPLTGCIGALDGICVKIKQPESHHGPAGFYYRKGYYSVPVQALVDARYRFVLASAIFKGSTHDSLAHSVSYLGGYVAAGLLEKEFWVAGDEAYACDESLLTPYPASLLQGFPYRDAYNFFNPPCVCTSNRLLDTWLTNGEFCGRWNFH